MKTSHGHKNASERAQLTCKDAKVASVGACVCVLLTLLGSCGCLAARVVVDFVFYLLSCYIVNFF